MKPLVYLKQELNGQGDFYEQWKTLEAKDKADLRAMAVEEMKVRGIDVEE